jgi:hypothetical protein
MGIDAQLRDEVGQILAEVGDPGGLLARAATRHALSGTVLLRYLMPWGDAVFNQAQAADLLRDLRSVRSEHEGRPLPKAQCMELRGRPTAPRLDLRAARQTHQLLRIEITSLGGQFDGNLIIICVVF